MRWRAHWSFGRPLPMATWWMSRPWACTNSAVTRPLMDAAATSWRAKNANRFEASMSVL